MKEETKLDLAKLSMELTIELIKDKTGRSMHLGHEKGQRVSSDPLAMFGAIYAHLSETITKE